MIIKEKVMVNGKRMTESAEHKLFCDCETTLNNSTVTDLSLQHMSKPQKDNTKNEP